MKNEYNFNKKADNKLKIAFFNKNKNEINNLSKNGLYNTNNFKNISFLEEDDDDNITSRNTNYIKKSKTYNKNKSASYINYFNNLINHNETKGNISNLKKNSQPNQFSLIENQSRNLNEDLNEIKINENNFYKSHSNLRTNNLNNNSICNLTKRIQNMNYTNRNSNNYKRIEYKNNKSLNDLYKIKNNNEIINIKNKNRNILYKNINSFNDIPISLLTTKNLNNFERALNEPIKRTKNKNKFEPDDNSLHLHKKSKSLNYNKILSDISSSFLNNINNKKIYYISNNDYKTYNNKELIKEIEDNNYYDKKTINNDIDKKEYYYTFRKGKIPYNSFNYLSTKKTKSNINKNNNNPISLIDIHNKENLCNDQYNSNINYTNSIYLNNYNRKICRIKKEKLIKSSNNSFRKKNNNIKGNLYDLTYKKESIKQMSNTNFNTNNDTKGASISSFSLYQTKSPKDNQSIKNSSRHSSIDNSKRNNPNINLSKQTNLKRNSIKKNNKQNIRKYINSINTNMDNVVQNEKNGLKYYCYYPDEKENRIKKSKLKIDSKVVNECYLNINNYNINNNKKYLYSNRNGKCDKSMTLQSMSDSKMMDLAEYYINNGDDSLEQMDLKLFELKKNIKKEKTYKDITFG